MKKKIFSLILVLSIVLGAINPIFTQVAVAAQDQDVIPIVNGEPKEAPKRSDGLGYFKLDLNINPVLKYKQGKVKEGEPEAFYVVRSGEKITLKDELPEIEVGEGFIFKGWLPATRSYTTASFEEAKDEITVSGSLHSSVGNDITYKAMYSKAVIMNFNPGKHGKIVSGSDQITLEFETLRGSTHFNEESPKVEVNNNSFWEFTGWTYRLPNSFTLDGDIGSSRSFTNEAKYEYIGPKIVPQPGKDKPDVPDNFVLVEFLPGEHGTLSGTTKYWVDPNAGKTLADADIEKPKVTANEDYKHSGWDKLESQPIKQNLQVTAEYRKKVVTENPSSLLYEKVRFETDKGDLKGNRLYWVLKDEKVKFDVPTVDLTGVEGYAFKSWDPVVQEIYSKSTTHKATFTYIGDNVIPQPGDDKPDNVPANFVLVEFKEGEHGTLTGTTKYWVNPDAGKTLADVAKPTVTPEDGWKHTGWDKEDTTAITEALEVTAQYKAKVVTEDPNDEDYVKVDFATTKGTVEGTKEYWVLKDEEVEFTAPTVDLTGVEGYEFKAWDPAIAESYSADTTHNATFNYTGNDIVPQEPGEDKPEVPDNFVLVEFLPGENGTLTGTTKYWVNPEVGKTLADVAKPSVTANDGFKFTGWDKEDTTEIKGALEVTAQYKAKVVTEDPQDEDYVKVDFATTKGTVEGTTEYWVLKDEQVTFTAPIVNMDGVENYTFKAWDPDVKTTYAEDTTHNATFNYTGKDVVPQPGEDKPDVPDNFVEVKFLPGTNGTLEGTTKYWVNPTAGKTLADVTKPTVTPEDGWKHTGWNKADTEEIKGALEVTAEYKAKVVTENPNDEDYVKVSFATTRGTVEGTKEYWVLKDEQVTFTAPTVNMDDVENYTFKAWDPAVKTTYAEDTTHNATFNYTGGDVVPQPGEDRPDVPENFVLVEFLPGTNGTLEGTTKYWVNPTAGKTLADVAKPSVTANDGFKFTGWDKEDTVEIKEALTVTALYDLKDNEKYEPETDPIEKEPGEPTTEDDVIGSVTIPNYPEDKEDPKITVTNPDDLPDGNIPGEYDIPVVIEYPDGSKDETTVTVVVKDKPDNEKYEPETDPIEKEPGEPTTEDEVIEKVTIPNYPEDKEDPKITVKNPDDLPDGNTPGEYEIPVVVEYPDGSKDETTVTVVVNEKPTPEKSSTPTVDKVTEGDDKITGKGEPGSDIIVELPDGTKIPGKVDEDGNWEVEIPADKPLNKDDVIKVVQKEEGKDPSDPVEVTITEKPEPAPEKSNTPEVDKITEGDDKITGKGEPGSDIVVELPDGTKLEGKVDEDGNWTVEIPADKTLKANDKIKVIQTEKGKTASNIIEVVVSKKAAQKVDEKVTEKPGKSTPNTGDAGMILTSAVTALSAAAYVFTKKRKED